MEQEIKTGTIIMDGRIINLDTISNEDLDEIEKRLEMKQEEIRALLDKETEEDLLEGE